MNLRRNGAGSRRLIWPSGITAHDASLTVGKARLPLRRLANLDECDSRRTRLVKTCASLNTTKVGIQTTLYPSSDQIQSRFVART